ncbi:MAG: polymer-forming cytoskeletal protein [Microscillaceae bacterium]|nr:polymer-forming cytoskeletal protein [Microscillaceae bacterium]
MAMFGSNNNNNNNNKEVVKETRPTEANNNSETRIGKGATLYGDIETAGNIRLDGQVVGNIRSKARVVLGESAQLKGNLLAQNAEIFGEIDGRVEIADILTLKSSSNVKGDVICNKFVTESGANFNGKCQMGNAIKEITFEDRTHLIPAQNQNKPPVNLINEKAKIKPSL